MQIALVYRWFDLTGSLARRTVELARHLSASHEVEVFSIGDRTNASLAPACVFHDVPVPRLGDGVRFSARELLTFAVRAARAMDPTRFDVVHVCNPSAWIGDVLHLPGVARGEAELQGNSSLRFTASNVRHTGNAARWLIEHRALRNRALRRIHVDAPSVRADLERFYGIPPERVLVVPPPINIDDFRPVANRSAARSELGIRDDERTVLLFCGSDFTRKGLDRAIEAMAATDIDTELLVVGSCREEGEFRELARRAKVADRVRFVGRVSDPERYYHAADILLLPTRADVWGITPIEAMAAGIPSIVSTAAGSADEVRKAEAGIVLPEPVSVRELRDAIERLARNPALRYELGRRGLGASTAHSLPARLSRVEDDLETIAAERRRERSPAGATLAH